MMMNHNEYLNYELPDNWQAEENADNLLLYDPNGEGAITISFYSILDAEQSLVERVSVMAKRMIDQQHIKLNSHLIMLNREGKTILYGEGTTPDHWYIKLWFVAQSRKIVFATYFSERKNFEVKICAILAQV